MTLPRVCLFAIALLFALAPIPASAKLESSFVVLGPQGAIARAVLSDAMHCPSIRVGDSVQPMNIRAMPDAGTDQAFPVLVCELLIPEAITSATLDAKKLPLPNIHLSTVAAFGDTGCRMKGENAEGSEHEHDDHGAGKFQDCDSQSKWPFAHLARKIAAAKPDLVIHVGDYLYRESACPADDSGCRGSPY